MFHAGYCLWHRDRAFSQISFGSPLRIDKFTNGKILMKLSGWGRYPTVEAEVAAPRNKLELMEIAKSGNSIARGNGRAYGDSAISISNTIHMKHFNRMLGFNVDSGQIVAEAGVLLADIIKTVSPHGWFPFVTPGTKFVTVGGLIAADVHGKNHHKDGSFGNYVDWIDILNANGTIDRCSKTENTDLFEWTVGGMGLTGVIIRAAIRLRRVSSAWIEQKTIVADNIQHAIKIFEQSLNSTYSVAWIDTLQTGSTLGRSLVMLGEHAEASAVPHPYQAKPLFVPKKLRLSVPVQFPSWILNSLSVRTFNALYFWNGKRKPGSQIVDWGSFFYPLDAILGWNKIYGKNGFAQFQCVIPLNHAEQGLSELLQTIANTGNGSVLTVLKRLGAQTTGRFSFPMEGYTLALDFPVNKKTLDLMNHLDHITLKYGGRVYLAKDSRISRDAFTKSEYRANKFIKYRKEIGSSKSYCSLQSERLGL